MSQTLPNVNLTGLSVNQSITACITNLNISANPVIGARLGYGTMRMHNESGTGLLVQTKTNGDQFNLPAGGWIDAPIKPGESALIVTALYVISLPPVQLLLLTYYQPGEPVPPMTILGNSPIAGSTNTTIAQSVSNESNSSETLFIDGGQVGNTFLIQIYTDGSFIWSVLQSGVPIQVLKGQIAGNPLLLGLANKTVEVLGNLLIDGSLQNSQGTVRGPFFVSPFLFANNATLTNGSTTTYQITPSGMAGDASIPVGTTFVMVSAYGTGAAAGAYVQMGQQGFGGGSNASNYPLFGQSQGGSDQWVGSAIVPLNTGTGALDVKAPNGQINNFNASVYGYFF